MLPSLAAQQHRNLPHQLQAEPLSFPWLRELVLLSEFSSLITGIARGPCGADHCCGVPPAVQVHATESQLEFAHRQLEVRKQELRGQADATSAAQRSGEQLEAEVKALKEELLASRRELEAGTAHDAASSSHLGRTCTHGTLSATVFVHGSNTDSCIVQMGELLT